MRQPDTFLVGAPKCGTTAMNDYLEQHPEIFMARTKELHYFGSDLHTGFARLGREQYLAYFQAAGDERRVGEASVNYLVSRNAAAEIRDFRPDARIIIMLRNPVDMMYSLHSQLMFLGCEDIEDFGRALEAEEDRKAGRGIPSGAGVIEDLYYRHVTDYAPQVRRFFDAFGREQVLVIVFDDFKADVAVEFRRTLEFLDVDPSFQPPLGVVNPNKRTRFRWLQRVLFNRFTKSHKVRSLVPESLRRALWRPLIRLNMKREQRQPMDPELRRQLQAEKLPEVEALSELLGRDLTHWCRDGQGGR